MIGPRGGDGGRAYWAEWLRLVRLEAEAIVYPWDARSLLEEVIWLRKELHWYVNSPRRRARKARKDAAWWRERAAFWRELGRDGHEQMGDVYRLEARAASHDDEEAFYRALRDELTAGRRAIETWIRKEEAEHARISALLARLPG
jgi:hypothetical protein